MISSWRTSMRHWTWLHVALLWLAGSSAAAADAPPEELVLPVAVEEPAPEYPAAALEDDVEADVLFLIGLDAEGALVRVEVQELVYYTWDEEGAALEESRDPDEDPYGFVTAAREALDRHVFEPALLPDGSGTLQGVPIELLWEIRFVIDEVEIERELELDPDDPWLDVEPIRVGEGTIANVVGEVRAFGGPAQEAGQRVALRTEAGDEVAAAVTDTRGRFAFVGVSPGAWSLTLDVIEGRTEPVSFEVSAGERTEVVLFVQPVTAQDEELLITRTVTTAPPPSVTRRTLRTSEIQRIPGNAGDPIRAVQNLPGVARASFGGGDVIVRGSSPQDTGFLIDGAPIPSLYHFGGLRSVFPAEILEAIDFYPGGFGVQYGRRTGGYLTARTREPRTDGLHGFVDVNVIDTGVLLEGPLTETLSFSLSGRRSYIDAILLPLADVLELNFATAPRYYDYQARLQFNPDPAHRFSILFYGSDDLVDFILQDERDLPPEQRGGIRALSRFHAALFRYDSRLSDRLSNAFRFQVSSQQLEFNLGEDFIFELDALSWYVRNTTDFEFSEQFLLRWGVDIETVPAELTVRAPLPPREGDVPLDFDNAERFEVSTDTVIYQPAAFLETEIRPTERLLLVPGTRLEWYREPGRWALDGRLFGRYAFTDQFAVKAAVGTYHQAPQPNELDSTRTFGNPDLQLQRAVHYVAGVETVPVDGLEANIELFVKDLRRFVSGTDALVEVDGEVVPQIYDNAGVGRVYGAEILIRYFREDVPVTGWVAWTLSRSERRDRPGDPWRLFDSDQPSILTAVGAWRLPRDWSLGARFRLVSGNPTSPVRGAVYNAETDSYVPIYGGVNSERFPAFHQLDLRVDKRWQFDAWRLELYLDLQNAYNRMNPEAFAYSYDYSERARITGLPLLPSFGLRAEW